MRARRVFILTLAVLAVAVAPAQAADESHNGIPSESFGYDGHYLPTLDLLRGDAVRVRAFSPLENTWLSLLTVKPSRPRGAVYVTGLHAAEGTVTFSIRRDRYARGYGSAYNVHTVYAWRAGMDRPQMLYRSSEVFVGETECGRAVGSVQAIAGGKVAAVVHDADHKVQDGKCVAGRRKQKSRLLVLSPEAPPRELRLPHGLTYDDLDGIYPAFSANASPDGLYFGGDTGERFAYTRLADGRLSSFAAPAGYRFLGTLLGPGGQLLATARKKNAVRVLYFPSLDSPGHFFDLQNGRGDRHYRDPALYGRFCGDRPVVVDSDRGGYTVYDKTGLGTLFLNGRPTSIQSVSVGCTATALVTQLFDQRSDSDPAWTSVPIP